MKNENEDNKIAMDTERKILRDLLSQVSTIVKKHNDLAATTGENFNVFSILDLSTAEVRLHSKLLAELLNPRGSHSLGDVFFKLFINRLNSSHDIGEHLKYSKTEDVFVEVEKWTGKLDTSTDTGGYIDIFIKLSDDRALVIENKIYAGDQESQLRRYYNFYKNKKPVLVYLTLDGREADEITTKNNKYPEEFIQPIFLSYKNDIKGWLEECRKEATNLPVVRETITQYINLIKFLTGQTISNNMKNELVKLIIESGDKVKCAFEIASSLDDVKNVLLKKFGEEIIKRVGNAKPHVKCEMAADFGKKWKGISFRIPASRSTSVFFSFLTDYNGVYLEIVNDQNTWDGKVKKVEVKNVEYYRSALLDVSKNWGKVENTLNAWNGDWVCRYTKMDEWIKDCSLWYDIAENKFDSKAEEVAKDIVTLLEAIEKKPF